MTDPIIEKTTVVGGVQDTGTPSSAPKESVLGNIGMLPPTTVTDNIITAAVPDTPVVPIPTEPAPATSVPPSVSNLFRGKPSETAPQSNEPAPPAQPTTEPLPITPNTPEFTTAVETAVAQKVAEIEERYKAVSLALEEYQADPYGFAAKYQPHLLEKFDTEAYVADKLREEFGDFKPDPLNYANPATNDFKYVERARELWHEANNYKATAQTTITQNKAQEQANLLAFKETKAQALGVSLDDFNSKIWSKIESVNDENLYDMLIEGIVNGLRLQAFQNNLATSPIKPPNGASPTVNAPVAPVVDETKGKIQNLFGSAIPYKP